jgi:hypothetical protein
MKLLLGEEVIVAVGQKSMSKSRKILFNEANQVWGAGHTVTLISYGLRVLDYSLTIPRSSRNSTGSRLFPRSHMRE